jgi:hypothetical protein
MMMLMMVQIVVNVLLLDATEQYTSDQHRKRFREQNKRKHDRDPILDRINKLT